MADVVNAKMIVLWEEEIREAATRLAVVRSLTGNETLTDEEDKAFGAAVIAALNACLAAIGGANDDDAAIVLAAKRTVLHNRGE